MASWRSQFKPLEKTSPGCCIPDVLCKLCSFNCSFVTKTLGAVPRVGVRRARVSFLPHLNWVCFLWACSTLQLICQGNAKLGEIRRSEEVNTDTQAQRSSMEMSHSRHLRPALPVGAIGTGSLLTPCELGSPRQLYRGCCSLPCQRIEL